MKKLGSTGMKCLTISSFALLCWLYSAPVWAASAPEPSEAKKSQMPEVIPTSPAMTVQNRNALMEAMQSNPTATDLSALSRDKRD